MTDGTSALRFDRAEYQQGSAAGPACGVCKGPIGSEYWRWQRLVFCAKCRPVVEARLAVAGSRRAFAVAALQGLGVALACGVGYAVFVGLTKMQLSLVTIGIAYLVGHVVRRASGGLGGPRYQALAVAFTYLAATMGYAPGILEAIGDNTETHQEASAATGKAPVRSGDEATEANEKAPADDAATTNAPAERHGFRLLWFAYGILFLFGIMLAAPFLEATSAPIGLLIVCIGLYQAWKLTRGTPQAVDGPYRVAAAPAAPAPEDSKTS